MLRPEIEQESFDVEQDLPPGLRETVYREIGAPPLEVGACQVIVTLEPWVTALTRVGAPGLCTGGGGTVGVTVTPMVSGVLE